MYSLILYSIPFDLVDIDTRRKHIVCSSVSCLQWCACIIIVYNKYDSFRRSTHCIQRSYCYILN